MIGEGHPYIRPPMGLEGDDCGYCLLPKNHPAHGEEENPAPEVTDELPEGHQGKEKGQ